jgi:hypothetical protein
MKDITMILKKSVNHKNAIILLPVIFLLLFLCSCSFYWHYTSLDPKCPFKIQLWNTTQIHINIDSNNLDPLRIARFENNSKKIILTYKYGQIETQFKDYHIFFDFEKLRNISAEAEKHSERWYDNHKIEIIVYKDSTILDKYEFYRFIPK